MVRKNPSRHVPERFLRQLWKNQQFRTLSLATTDGRPIEVISPGSVNRNGGPDFTGAVIRIGGTLFRGDVELHQHAEEWTAHMHHDDPKYNSVILHAVFEGRHEQRMPSTASSRSVPVLVLSNFLLPSFHSTWDEMIRSERAERTETIRCYSVNDDIGAGVIQKWLTKLAVERIELKVRSCEERLKELVDQQHAVVREARQHYGEIPFGINPEDLPPPVHPYSQHDFARPQLWNQLLYENLMESLGYSKNQKPFLRLARSLTLQQLSDLLGTRASDARLRVESALFHVSGLIPLLKDITDAESKARIRALRKEWKQMKKMYRREILAAAEWQFFRLRPENFPTVRLAGAAGLAVRILQESILKKIIGILKDRKLKHEKKFHLVEEEFVVPADDFWSHHVRFEERSTRTAQTLIGKNRAADIVMNVVIPICLLYARKFRDTDARQGALKLFESAPELSHNSITRLMESQLIKGRFETNSGMLQQGMIQLQRQYCCRGRCAECAVGALVFRPPPHLV